MRVSLDRAREIFGRAGPPAKITERQFDYLDDELQRLGRTPIEEINPSDLWYYHHDLAHVPLQPDLFAYLFPACLWDWHVTLLANQPCSHGDSDFHCGVIMGRVFDTMLTSEQRKAVFAFLRDSMLDRLDQERGFVYDDAQTPPYGWLGRWNSLGLIMPEMELLWDEWEKLSSPGQAMAAIQYISLLTYFADEHRHPLFGKWTPDQGGGVPTPSGTDTLGVSVGWLPQNVDFVKRRLSVERIRSFLDRSVQRLLSEPDFPKARQFQKDFHKHLELVESRLSELPAILASPDCQGEWTV